MTKYARISTACSIKFQPFIFETTGRIHKDSLAWFRKAFRTNVEGFNGYKENRLLEFYWINRVCSAYQRQVAVSIIESLRRVRGTSFAERNYENRSEFILSSCSTLPVY